MTLALIDADILVYQAAYRAQESFEWKLGEFTEHANIDNARMDFASMLEDILKAVGADQKILALSSADREKNFRRRCWPDYKKRRSDVAAKRPLLYLPLRQWLRMEYGVKEKPYIEADDTLGILATYDSPTMPPVEERIICSIDKDLLTIPGLHYNWKKKDDGVFDVAEDVAFGYFMCQTLMGDSVDGYPGCPTIGPVKAMRVLGDVQPKDMWKVVLQTFATHGLDKDYALSQARCARILRAKDWDFPTEQPLLWIPERDEWK